jgi:predicted dehydrogenase
MPLLEEGIARGFRRIVVEKPFSCSVAEARRALAQARSAGARVLVNHSRRYCPNFRKIAARVPELAHLGRLRTVSSTHGGGGLGCVGVHYIDLCNMLFGHAPKAVFAQLTEVGGRNPRGDRFFDPGAAVMLSYPGGGRAYLDFGDDIGVFAGLEMVFEEGIIRHGTDEFARWEIECRGPEDRGKATHLLGLALRREDFPGWCETDSMSRWTQLMTDAAEDTQPLSDAAFGLACMQVFAAARWSARTGQAVAVPPPADAEAEVYPIP